MKICLPCPGLEHIQRGFETYTRELFGALQGHCEVHLVKASGRRNTRVHVVPTLRRTSRLFDILPCRMRTDYRRLQSECALFALGMIPLLRREQFDVIHFSEVPLGRALLWLRQRFSFRYRLLFSNGAPYQPWDYEAFDAVHQVSPAHDAAGREFGLPSDRSLLVPYGTASERLNPPINWDRLAARRILGLPEQAFVVLSLAALNRHHKRIDWLIEEVAKLQGNPAFLVLAGNREAETASLEELATGLLPQGNFRFLQIPYDQVPSLLHTADVLVQCSLEEGFGRVYTEAMGAGVPLLAHPHLTAKWIIDNPDCFVDMTCAGDLSRKLDNLSQNPTARQRIINQNLDTFQRFKWETLVPEYVRMYERVCELAPQSMRGPWKP